jgi:hypothetical protein
MPGVIVRPLRVPTQEAPVEYRSAATIDAPPTTVAGILRDGPGYAAWDNGVVRVEGPIVDGGTIRVFSEVSPDRAFPVTVAVEGHGMTWTGGIPLGLFRGVRTFDVAPDGDGTRFSMVERFTGPLTRVMARSMPDLQPSFDQFASGLKAEAEGRRTAS